MAESIRGKYREVALGGTEDTLRRCPFCGDRGRSTIQLGAEEYFVLCENAACLAEGPVASSDEGARHLWNVRAVI